MDLPVNVANKRITIWLSPLDATLTKKQGESPSSQMFFLFLLSHLPYALPSSVCCNPFICRSYANCASRRFYGTKTAGVCTNNSHSGIHLAGACEPASPSLPLATEHGSRVTPLATLFYPWHANASANTFSPISIGAKKSRAPFEFRRTPRSRSRATINTAGSKLAQDTVK